MMSMHNQLISIAMCTYNGERYLKEQLNSILQQSHHNIEVVICDDKSTDNTVAIIKQFQQSDSRIRLYQNSKNLGYVKNFEKAISLCTGLFIALSDQDDVWLTNKLAMLIKKIGHHSLIYTDSIPIDDQSKIINSSTFQSKNNLFYGQKKLAFLFFNCISGNTILFKRELIADILPIPEKVMFHDIWIAFTAAARNGIAVYNTPLIHYRRHDAQITIKSKSSSSSILKRLGKKTREHQVFSKNIFNLTNAFTNSGFLSDSEEKLLREIKVHFNNIDNGFFNLKIFFLLLKNRNEIFFIKPKKYFSYSIKYSAKILFLKMILFSI